MTDRKNDEGKELLHNLFVVTLFAVRQPEIRCNLSRFRHMLSGPLNEVWRNEWAPLHVPEWYYSGEAMKEKLVDVLVAHYVELTILPGYCGDFGSEVRMIESLAVQLQPLPEHLSEWDAQWESVIIPKIISMAKERGIDL